MTETCRSDVSTKPTKSKLMKPHSKLFSRYAFLTLLALLAFFASSCFVPVQGDNYNNVEQSYVPPPWAPPYDNVSQIRYYYLPDYEVYYDVWGNQFWYIGDGGVWVSSVGPPPPYAGVDLGAAFVVLIRSEEHT